MCGTPCIGIFGFDTRDDANVRTGFVAVDDEGFTTWQIKVNNLFVA